MGNTYSQINIHCIFAVQGKGNVITTRFRDDLYRYMSGILKNDGIFPLAIGGWTDHVHVFFELPPGKKVSDVMRDLKSITSKWINENRFVPGKFSWQEGYGAFSYSRRQRDTVIRYIMTQEEHHRKKTFKEEYLEFLEKFCIDFKTEYLFEFYKEE